MTIDVNKFISCLNSRSKDELYRTLWREYIEEDVTNRINERSEFDDALEEDINQIIKEACDLFVFEGDYDCSLSYWQNIDNVINKAAYD